MKAITQDRYGSVNVLKFVDVDRPVPGADEVLVRVSAAGMDPGVWHLMTGLPYLMRLAGYGLLKPKNPVRGRDVAGTIEAMGQNVMSFQCGDNVFGIGEGSFAEFAIVKQNRLAHKPANLSFEQAAVVPISGLTALQALRQGRVRAGQHVLIVGASGGTGTFAVQLAKAFGAIVTGVCSSSKVGLVRSIGADRVIDYASEDFTQSACDYDLILDAAGNRPLGHLRRALTRHGNLVIIGGEKGGMWLGGIDRPVRAAMLSRFVSQTLGGLLPDENSEGLCLLRDLIEAGTIKPVIGRSYPLGQTANAISYMRQGHAKGKVVIIV